MFQSNRFNTVVTNDTRQRLLRAQSNQAPIAQGESHRGAVVAIQTAITALNQGYMSGSEIDGYFGPRTGNAVEAFQRDYGLIADRIVGRQVLTQLDSMFSAAATREPKGVSIHIGVDRVDPAHYGNPMTLPSCVNDANAMDGLARNLGYDSLVIVNEAATTTDFCAFLRSCKGNLFAGDCLFISFSGHGSQVPNTSGDEEPDLYDETLCFFDRMLIDDELFALLSDLRDGVRVHVVFDSCHSGTALKQLMINPDDMPDEQQKAYRKDVDSVLLKTLPFPGLADSDVALEQSPVPIKGSALDKALAGEQPEFVDVAPDAERNKDIGELFAAIYKDTSFGRAKYQDGTQIYQNNKTLYDTVKDVVGSKEGVELTCTVSTLSACADAQTTPAGSPLSLFTFNLTQAWSSFNGSYIQFHRAVKNRSRPDATPQLNAYGANGAEARLHERPFAF